MTHVVLLGDSIFDNGAYTRGGPDVVTQLRGLLPDGWRATLLAVDGDTTAGIARQVARVPADAQHLVVSVGGNDALGQTGLVERAAQSAAQVLGWLADAAEAFERDYRAALARVLALGRPTTVCTIYDGSFPDRAYQRIVRTALAVFDDVVLRAAFALGLPVIELRLVCTEPGDYANPIEPSSQGGAKIAAAIARAVGAAPSPDAASRVHVDPSCRRGAEP
jgi:lysophospholipase L1-like esterase